MIIKEQVRQYIVTNILFDDRRQFGDDDSLLAHQIIDSTGVMELVLFLEERFGVEIPDRELTRENLDSLNKIEQYLQHKMTKEVDYVN